MTRLVTRLTQAFPVWVLAASAVALGQPAWFTWFSGPWIGWGLAVIMLGMGLTLTPEDFRGVARMPRAVALGFAAQYTIMPLLGWSLGRAFGLAPAFAVGLVLVGCCPGGTASNVVTYLARANVCLSVVMTMVSTFAAVALTPLLTSWLAGTFVRVDAWGMFRTTLQVVVAPVLLGVALNRRAPGLVRRVQLGLPLVAVLVIALICASVIGSNQAAVRGAAGRLLAALLCLHAGGFALGYAAARLLGCATATARTVSIEVGMQNAGLGVELARRHFADPLTAVPCAISAVFHSVIGSGLAAWWRWRDRPAGGAAD